MSGGLGCGAFTSSEDWFQLQWPDSWVSVHNTVKELLPIVLDGAVWGPPWRGRTVRCQCDNVAVVVIVRSGTSRNPLVMHLMRCLSFCYQLYLDPVYLPGKYYNEQADALSRDNLSLFLQLNVGANGQATPVLACLIDSVVRETPGWASPTWTAVLHSILRKD